MTGTENGVWSLPLRFDAPVQFLFPNWATANHPILKKMVDRSLAGSTCLFGKELPRSKSIFFYSTLYATALIVILPVQVYLARISQGGMRLFWGLAVLLSSVGLLLTTSRGALVALVSAVGAVTLLWLVHRFYTRPAQRVRLFLALVVALGIGAMAAAVLPWVAGTAIGSADLEACGAAKRAAEGTRGLRAAQAEVRAEQQQGGGVVSSLLGARGMSFEGRFAGYRGTLDYWAKRPAFGWATQRYSTELRHPLGSHSLYLGTLYQRGAVGLTVLLAILGYAAFRLVRGLRRSNDPRLCFFLGCAAVSLLAATINGITDIFDIDVTVQVLFWTLLGLIIGATAPTREGEA